MARVVLLDSNPLSMVSNPAGAAVNQRCRTWMESLLQAGILVRVPEITDYELRRVLLHERKAPGLVRLDEIIRQTGGLLSLDNQTMQKAAELWAEARHRGRAMADNARLDIDVILCAHARISLEQGNDVEVASENTRHLCVFVKARPWYRIKS